MKASLGQFLLNLHNLGMIPCFQSQLEEAAGDGHVGIGAVVVYRDHISTAAGNDFRDFLQLARFVCQGNGETDVSSAGQKPPGNHAAENIDVNVSAGDDTNHLFPFYRQFMKKEEAKRLVCT